MDKKSRKIHYPVGEDHPTTRKESRNRATLCRPTTATMVDLRYRKSLLPTSSRIYKWGMMNTTLGWNYDSKNTAYFSRDKAEVTCEKCKQILKKRESGENPLEIRILLEKKKRQLRRLEQEIKELTKKLSLNKERNNES